MDWIGVIHYKNLFSTEGENLFNRRFIVGRILRKMSDYLNLRPGIPLRAKVLQLKGLPFSRTP